MKRDYLSELRQTLVERFDEGELRTVCFDLDVDYDILPGEGKANKARELVAYLERRSRIVELIEVGQRIRPDISWVYLRQAATQDIQAVQRSAPEHPGRGQGQVPSMPPAAPSKPRPSWSWGCGVFLLAAAVTGAAKFFTYHFLLTVDNSPDRYEQAADLSNIFSSIVGLIAFIVWIVVIVYIVYQSARRS